MKKYIRPLQCLIALVLGVSLVPLGAMKNIAEIEAKELGAEAREVTVGAKVTAPKPPVEPRLYKPRNVKLGDKIKGEPKIPYKPTKHKILLKQGDIVGVKIDGKIKYARIIADGTDHEVEIEGGKVIPVPTVNGPEMYILEDQRALTAKKRTSALITKATAEKTLQNAMDVENQALQAAREKSGPELATEDKTYLDKKSATDKAMVNTRIEIRHVWNAKREASYTGLEEEKKAQEAAETKLTDAQERLKSQLPEEEEFAVQYELEKAQRAVNIAKAKQAQFTAQIEVDRLTVDFELADLKLRDLTYRYETHKPTPEEIEVARKKVETAKEDVDAATKELGKTKQAVTKATRG